MLQQTRGDAEVPKIIDFETAILNPSADFGGLFAPERLPVLNTIEMRKLQKLSYIDFTKEIFSFLEIELDSAILENALSTYRRFDNPNEPVALHKVHDSLYIQELFHGPTRAFKDMALQPFGAILCALAKKRNERYLILVATSGDTGPATLQAFQNDDNVCVVCLYPKNGTSDVQRRQMTTINARNVRVLGIDGNFDDAQSALKSLLADDGFKQALDLRRFRLSAANSVNFGRIIFQIVYHAYTSLCFPERGVDIIVPSGNFGNALGAFYAKLIGFDIGKIIIASNANNVLTDWITRGVYDIKERTLKQTQSPAMDILKSSNVERILYTLFGASRTRELLESLDSKKIYALSAKEFMEIQNYFDATFCTDKECRLFISRYAKLGHLVDPHTATALKAYEQFNIISNRIKVVVSTAEWTKFAPTVAQALGKGKLDDKEALAFVAKTFNAPIVPGIESLFDKEEIHDKTLAPSQIKGDILDWIATL